MGAGVVGGGGNAAGPTGFRGNSELSAPAAGAAGRRYLAAYFALAGLTRPAEAPDFLQNRSFAPSTVNR